jgi:hypothetical protein
VCLSIAGAWVTGNLLTVVVLLPTEYYEMISVGVIVAWLYGAYLKLFPDDDLAAVPLRPFHSLDPTLMAATKLDPHLPRLIASLSVDEKRDDGTMIRALQKAMLHHVYFHDYE